MTDVPESPVPEPGRGTDPERGARGLLYLAGGALLVAALAVLTVALVMNA